MGKKRNRQQKSRVAEEIPNVEKDHEGVGSRFGRAFLRARESARQFVSHRVNVLLLVYLSLYTVFGVLTVGFYPSYAWPGGDESTYLNRAMQPWTLIGDAFEGYPPMELVDPYSPRIFLLPFSVIFSLFGFTFVGARLAIFAYGLILLFVMFLIGCRVTSRGWSLAGVLLLSWSPQFVAHTHAIRQEGLTTLFFMIGVWLILRCGDRVNAATLFWLGAMGTSSIMVHHNGIVMAPIFFVAAVTYDFQVLAWRKIGWFVVGCGVASVVFLLIDFLPGLEKVREYGIMPVLYVSHGRIPLLQGSEFPELVSVAIQRYARYFRGFSAFEPRTVWFTASLLVPALFGVFYRAGRKERLLGLTLLMLCVAMVAVIPNSQFRYLFYLCPLVSLLAVVGLGKLSANHFFRDLSIIFMLVIVAKYGYELNQSIRQAWVYNIENEVARTTLRRLIAEVGEPSGVTVMGPGELHATAHDTRFRSFHSLIDTKDFEVSLGRLEPDIVILYPRSTRAMALYLFDPNFEGRNESRQPLSEDKVYRLVYKGLLIRQASGKWAFNRGAIPEQFAKDLELAGYERIKANRINWNGEPLRFFVKSSTMDASMSKNASVD